MDQREDYADNDLPPAPTRLAVVVRVLNAVAILTVIGVILLTITLFALFFLFVR